MSTIVRIAAALMFAGIVTVTENANNERRGTFVLQHRDTFTRGAEQLTVTIVPDSGTDQLTGIAGRMTITNSGGAHSYVFEYTLPGSR